MTELTSPAAPSAPAPTSSRGEGVAVDLVVLGAATLLLRLPAFFATKHLTFDDGVFAASALAMRDGDVPFRDVFSSQGPLFLPLVWLGDLAGGRTMNGPRVLAVVAGVVCVLAIYLVGRQLTDRWGALLAAGLATTAGSLVWVTGPLAADGPALAFVVIGFGLALRLRDRPTPATAALLGVAIGAGLSTKAIEAPVLLSVGLVLVAPFAAAATRRRFDPAALLLPLVAAACAVAVFVALALPFGFADVWDQAFTYRADAAHDRDVLANAGKLFATLWDRDLAVLAFAVVAAGCAALAHRRGRSARPIARGATPWHAHHPPQDPPGWMPSAPLLLVLWLGATLAWLVLVVSPLSRPHLSALIPPLALLVGAYRPPPKVLAVTALVLVPAVAVQLDGVRWPGPYRGSEAEVVALLRELPDGAWALSDDPGLVWRSGHRTTADLVDPSMYRVQQDRITEDGIAEQAADPRVCAVVVRSDERFGAFPGLPDRLAAEGYVEVLRSGGPRVAYVRPDCAG